jgi:hypothetical protein
MDTFDSRFRMRKAVVLGALVWSSACVHRPVTAPVAIVPDTVQSEVRLSAVPAPRFGDILPFGVGLSNGAATTYLVSGARIYAVDVAGRRVAPLAVEEAARLAGGAAEIMAGLRGAGGGALLGGLFGAVPGAILGAAHGGGASGTGAAVGAGIGLAFGAASGFFESRQLAEREIPDQLHGLALHDQALEPGMPMSGFVFYPSGEYVGVRAVVVDEATHEVVEVRGALIERAG